MIFIYYYYLYSLYTVALESAVGCDVEQANVMYTDPYFTRTPSPCPGDFFFPFLFSPVLSSDTHAIFPLVLQHCSTLSRAEFLLRVFYVLQIPSSKSFQPNGASEEALRCEIEELKQKDLALDQEIAQLLSEYVLGKLSVRCDALIIFVFKTKCVPGIGAESLPSMMPLLAWCNVGYSIVVSDGNC